jgi:hypothetical protein
MGVPHADSLVELIDHEYSTVRCKRPVSARLLAGADLKCANVHSLGEILINKGSWCTTNQSWILPSQSS